jgi:peptidoglycan hydrolase-like amidase
MNVRLLLPSGQIDEIELEEYLRAVVPAEVGASWPMEALKAQAIAARSFAALAVLSRPRHKYQNADLCTEVHCQAWRPAKVHPRTDQAISDTAGLVVVYQGHVAQAFYSARCGGVTRAAWFPSAAPWCRPVRCVCSEVYPGRPRRGHGVGACQIGMRIMAERGCDYERILHHYYAGVEILRLADLESFPGK